MSSYPTQVWEYENSSTQEIHFESKSKFQYRIQHRVISNVAKAAKAMGVAGAKKGLCFQPKKLLPRPSAPVQSASPDKYEKFVLWMVQ